MELQVINNNEYVITLKEITDLIGARHNDSMKKVEELAKEDGFGSLRKTRSQYESGKGRIDEIETYIFTKKQAIAVGARLNTTMLMKVINRLEELELSKQFKIPQTFSEALLLASKQAEQIEHQTKLLLEQKPKVEFYEAVTGSKDTIDMGNVAKVLNKNIGRNKLFELLREKGVLMSSNVPYQKYCDCGYFRVIESKYTKPDGSTHIGLKTVVYQKGVNYINKLLGV